MIDTVRAIERTSGTWDATAERALAGSARRIRGLIVDLAKVVYDATAWRRKLWRLISRLGVGGTYAEFSQTWCRQYLADVRRGWRDHDEALEAFLLAQGLTWAEIDEVEAARRGFDALDDRCRPLPGASATLAKLSALRLPIVAWADIPYPAARLERLLADDGLTPHFRHLLCSFELGNTQPAADCYRAGLEALQLPPDCVLYLGQDPESLTAAKALGLLTAALDVGQPVAADFYLTRFDDLLSLARSKLSG